MAKSVLTTLPARRSFWAVERQPFIQRRFTFRFYNATLIILALNVAVFLLVQLAPRSGNYLAMWSPLVVERNWWWQVFTYMFVHAGFTHILLNMLGLFIFGTALERRIGSDEFLLFYLLTGTLAGLFSLAIYWFTAQYHVILVGASGAVYAVLLAAATYYPRATVRVYFLIPVRLPVLALVYLAFDVFGAIRGGTGVAHLTHLAGAAFAFLYLVIRLRINPVREFLDSRR
jgi:membrane associated rhomboid family serine protease